MSLNDKEEKKRRLLQAVGKILSKEGFQGLGVNKIAKQAGVDKVLLYRYFGSLPELVLAFSHTVDFWPTLEELLGPNPKRIRKLGPNEQMAYFFKSFLRALRKRPMTINILSWRNMESNDLSRQIDDVRMRSALEFFEFLENIPEDRDLTAIVVLLFSAVTTLISRSQQNDLIGGIDLSTKAGWKRIEDGIDLLFQGTFTKGRD